MRRPLLGIVAGCVSLGTAGCFIPFAVPRVDTAPPVSLSTLKSRSLIHAFRVDVTERIGETPPKSSDRFERFTRVDLDEEGWTPLLVQPSVTHGFFVFPTLGNSLHYTRRSVCLRLYWPGWRVVQLDRMGDLTGIDWEPVEDDGAEMRELDALFRYESLASGTESPEHAAALQFGATEYDRIAAHASMPALKEMATKAAQRLRDLTVPTVPTSGPDPRAVE